MQKADAQTAEEDVARAQAVEEAPTELAERAAFGKVRHLALLAVPAMPRGPGGLSTGDGGGEAGRVAAERALAAATSAPHSGHENATALELAEATVRQVSEEIAAPEAETAELQCPGLFGAMGRGGAGISPGGSGTPPGPSSARGRCPSARRAMASGWAAAVSRTTCARAPTRSSTVSPCPNFHVELIPAHSQILSGSYFVSYPPLTCMLKIQRAC